MKPFRRIPLLAAGALMAGHLAAEEPALSLSRAIAIAIEANPSLAAERLKSLAAQDSIDVAREIPNPDFTYETEKKETPHDAFTIALPVETGGKRGRRIRVAEAGALTGEAELRQTEAQLRNDVRRAFYSLVAARDRRAQAADLQGLAERIHSAARDRFDAGAAPRLEVVQAELSAGQTANEVLDAQGTESVARTELNALLALPPDRPTVIDGDLAEGEVLDSAAAGQIALASNAEMQVFDRRVLEETARLDLVRADRFPDPVLQGTLTHGAEPEYTYGWRAGVTVTLPVFHHHAAAVRVQEHVLAQLQAERAASAARIQATVFSAVARAAALRAQVVAYREQMLPKADEVQSMAEDSYREGQTNVVAMIQAVQAVREVRARALQAGLDYQIALADLERAIGAPLP